MPIDAWLPVGLPLPGGSRVGRVRAEGPGWQIFEVEPLGRALVVQESLASRWLSAGLVESGALVELTVGGEQLRALLSGPEQRIEPVGDGRSPTTLSEAISFGKALHETRSIEPSTSLYDAVFVERYSRLLPSWSTAQPVSDDVVIGAWLSGGVRISVRDAPRVASLVPQFTREDLGKILRAAGLGQDRSQEGSDSERGKRSVGERSTSTKPRFSLSGRSDLERFFTEHVIDIVQNEDRYRALGIEFPLAIVLHGPPGCGKTFAVERLVEYLEWPQFSVDSSSIGSPYIHETGRKIARVFDDAMHAAPAVVVIDEMESFLSDRVASAGSGSHRVEEVAEFLRRIPEASKRKVLVIGMTNHLDLIDPALLRRGRFDHLIELKMPSAGEVRALLEGLVGAVPNSVAGHLDTVVSTLSGRPLSDAAFVVREGCRLAARAGREILDPTSLEQALMSLPAREPVEEQSRPIGFR